VTVRGRGAKKARSHAGGGGTAKRRGFGDRRRNVQSFFVRPRSALGKAEPEVPRVLLRRVDILAG